MTYTLKVPELAAAGDFYHGHMLNQAAAMAGPFVRRSMETDGEFRTRIVAEAMARMAPWFVANTPMADKEGLKRLRAEILKQHTQLQEARGFTVMWTVRMAQLEADRYRETARKANIFDGLRVEARSAAKALEAFAAKLMEDL